LDMSALYEHVPHPHVSARQEQGPVKVANQHAAGNAFTRFNSALAVRITNVVGSMACAYAFTALSLISLPAAIKTGDPIIIVAWIAQTFLQLVLLSVILLGQKIQAQASDLRAEATYHDATATLHEAEQIQQHLLAQDAALLRQDAVLADLISRFQAVTAPPPKGMP